MREVERILRDRRHMGYHRDLQENFQLESGRRGRDSVRPPLHTDGGGPPRDNVCSYTGQQSPRSEPSPPTTKVASQGEGQGDALSGRLRLRLKLGRTKNRLGSIDEEAERLRRDMSAACDASMPRSVPGYRRDQCVYWWTPEIAETRARCVRARRRLQRARRRRRTRDEEEISRYYEAYREIRLTMQREIKIAKARSWMELIESVESDPWGRPYRLVKKLRPRAPPLTARTDPALLAKVIGTLFPRRDNDARQTGLSSPSDETTEWSEELRVTQEELLDATKRMASRDVAPGPDGIPGRVWAESMTTLAPRL